MVYRLLGKIIYGNLCFNMKLVNSHFKNNILEGSSVPPTCSKSILAKPSFSGRLNYIVLHVSQTNSVAYLHL